MADASDTMRYLVRSFDIAPAGTREEGQAAKGLSEVFHEHGLETANKSFRYSSLGKVPQAVCLALVGIAGILSGVAAGGVLPIVMFVVGAVFAALYALEVFLGIKTVSRLGISGSSQNVVARHPAASPLNGQKARPVVVIAHYDTPRADIFAIPLLSHIRPYLGFIVAVAVGVDVVGMLFQMLPVPTVLHSIAWALSVVSSAVLVVWAVCVILQRFAMPFTVGANDNKASIAALFGLLDRVRPLEKGPGFGPNDALYEAMEEETGHVDSERRNEEEGEDAHVHASDRRRSSRPAVERDERVERDGRVEDGEPRTSHTRRTRREAARPKEPVRYGIEVVRSLGIVPATCVIKYETPEPSAPAASESGVVRVRRASDSRQADQAAGQGDEAIPGATVMMSAVEASSAAGAEPSAAEETPAPAPVASKAAPQPALAASLPQDPEAIKDAAADAIMAGIVGTNTLSGSHADVPAQPAPAAGATSLMAPVSEKAPAPAPQPEEAQASFEPHRQADYAPQAPQPAAYQQPFRVITSSDDYDAELLNSTSNIPPDVAAQSAAASSSFFNDDFDSASASVVNDPMWGTSSFRPVSAGRRILSDIPDPAVAAVDPFSVSSIEPVGNYNPDDFSGLDFETGTHQTVTPAMLEYERHRALDGFSPEITEAPKRARKNKKGHQGRISHQAARMQAEMQEQSFNDWLGLDENFDAKTNGRKIGSWDHFNDDQEVGAAPAPGNSPRWQGGAARSRRASSRRDSDADAASEARRAAMTLGDRELIAHEIWFVLTGASEADHAGVEDFLKTYRTELRGAYFVNIECIGAGRQSLVLEEGDGRRRVKADHRLVNLFGAASLGINRPLALTRMAWRDTEATPLLRQGCRAVTVSGVKNGVPAHARWTGDTPEKVDTSMIDDIVDILVEVIKNA